VTHVADRADLGGTLESYVERERLDGTAGALEILVVEQHFLQLWVGLAHVTEFIVPLVNGGIGQPDGSVAGLVLSGSATNDGLVLERDRIIPSSILSTREISCLLLLAGCSGIGRSCHRRSNVRHGIDERM
jgi:hypothetical protein